MHAENSPPLPESKKRGCLFYVGITTLVIFLIVGASVACTAWWMKRQLHAKPMTPVELSLEEQAAFDQKVGKLSGEEASVEQDDLARIEDGEPLSRTISMTEKEINAMLHHNTGLGDKVYVTLLQNAIHARANIPIDVDAPFIGGKTLRGKMRVQVQLVEKKLVLKVKDVTMAGIPLPNAWLGGLKNVNLVDEYFAGDEGFGAFVDGIESLQVEKGQLVMKLAE